MITLNITIGGNLLIELDGKSAKKELKEIIEKATNTDAILTDLLDLSGYLGNSGWEETTGVLTEAPILGHNALYNDQDELEGYESVFYYADYMVTSFAEELLKNNKVIFKRA